jgi:hypothetical protein
MITKRSTVWSLNKRVAFILAIGVLKCITTLQAQFHFEVGAGLVILTQSGTLVTPDSSTVPATTRQLLIARTTFHPGIAFTPHFSILKWGRPEQKYMIGLQCGLRYYVSGGNTSGNAVTSNQRKFEKISGIIQLPVGLRFDCNSVKGDDVDDILFFGLLGNLTVLNSNDEYLEAIMPAIQFGFALNRIGLDIICHPQSIYSYYRFGSSLEPRLRNRLFTVNLYFRPQG